MCIKGRGTTVHSHIDAIAHVNEANNRDWGSSEVCFATVGSTGKLDCRGLNREYISNCRHQGIHLDNILLLVVGVTTKTKRLPLENTKVNRRVANIEEYVDSFRLLSKRLTELSRLS